MIKACRKPENIEPDGSINWDFVDADCFALFMPETPDEQHAYYDAFNVYAGEIEPAQNL